MNPRHVLGQSFELFVGRYNGPRNRAACLRAYLKDLEHTGQLEIRTYAQEHWDGLMELHDAIVTVAQEAAEVSFPILDDDDDRYATAV